MSSPKVNSWHFDICAYLAPMEAAGQSNTDTQILRLIDLQQRSQLSKN